MTYRFDDILEANREYAGHFDLKGLSAPAAMGLGVLTCIDSRIKPLEMMGIGPGDAKIFRNAGARITNDALRSLILATNLLSVRRIMVVAHTDCAMAKHTNDEFRDLFHDRYPEAQVDHLDFHAAPNQVAALEEDVARLLNCEMLPKNVAVGGFIYDVETGLLRQVVK